jgi:hypothetical protein
MEDLGSVFTKAKQKCEKKKQEVSMRKEKERMLGTTF